ncbi:unnamed protein product [Protopolystoma xenopodis]|uniref:Uncharacterized protein n=1 Tax=Protopolystoma xenopodis TaxID=117903 RepID=A0A448XD10_9PLAT|nr:unnamed protein product [Protopolystoma xenopodis]
MGSYIVRSNGSAACLIACGNRDMACSVVVVAIRVARKQGLKVGLSWGDLSDDKHTVDHLNHAANRQFPDPIPICQHRLASHLDLYNPSDRLPSLSNHWT